MNRLLLALAVVSVGCAPITYDYSKEPDPRRTEYVIGPSDRVRISVWKNGDLGVEAVVRPDGIITMQLIGDVQVSGMTPTELRKEVQKRLASYVRDESAVVTVAVTDCNNYRFSVAGNVERASVFNSRYPITVAEAIALAGGINKFGSPRNVVVIRQQPNGQPPKRIPIDFRRVVSGEQPEANIGILAGDTVFVN